MNDDFKKYLKQLEQFQNRMNKLYEPLRTHSQIWMQQLNMNLEPLNNAMRQQMTAIEHLNSPIIEMLNKQKAVIEQQIAISNSSFDNIRKLHLNMGHLINSQLGNLNVSIPESFYSSLNELTLEFDNFYNLSEGNPEVITEITEREPSVTQEKKITWTELVNIVFIIWQVIFMLNSDQASSIQRDNQILETEAQTKLLEKQTEAIKEQTEAIKEQTKFEQERYEQQQRFEEKFYTFIKSLDPYITDQLPADDD